MPAVKAAEEFDENLDIDDNLGDDLVPTTLATSRKINDIKGKFWFKTLLDHGGSHVMIQA